MITSVIKNGPAQDAGLKTGDRIIRVDSTLVAGTGITNESITKMLRGKADSRVQLTLLHPGSRNPVLIDVKRDIIPIYSIDAAYMVDSAIGYIRINRFSATTYREFMQALRNLQKRGLRELILDLRQNPGGYLDAATAIADEFIGNDRLLVYTQGRATPKEEYKADKPGAFETGHLAVLVDESSASASEILAGAIQDWDRGVIIGQRTYGKGLVQEQYELGDGSALRLTIARYYTPTGRCIQRSYDKGRYAYEMDYYNRFLQQHTGGMQQPDSIKDHKKYFTERNHREVYGGGGILPDVVVPYNDPYISGPMYRLLSETVFNQTIYQYFSGHNNEFKDYASFSSFETSYSVSPELMALLKANYEKNFPDDVRYVWSDAAALHDLTFRVKALLARILFGNAGFFRMLNENDKVMARALSILKTPEYSKIMTGQSR